MKGWWLETINSLLMFTFYSIHKLVDSLSTKQMAMQTHLFHLLDGLVANAPYVLVIVFNTHLLINMHARRGGGWRLLTVYPCSCLCYIHFTS